MTQIRTKNNTDLKRERRPKAHSCWDHLIAAPLWPRHGVNLGTLLRTCDATGACMTVPRYSWVPEAIDRSYTFPTRGCVHWLKPLSVAPELWLEEQASREDTRIIGVELADEATRLADVTMVKQRTVMVLGNEQTGIPPEALDYLDECIEIPMIGSGTTLNVAVAGSLALYKLSGLI